ncbi:MAG: FGGY-family carbohydrate kinase [Egibacteraceae bacterium]
MADDTYLVGIDFGTESARVGIFGADGTPVTFANETYELHHPRPGWAEQDPDEWWSSLSTACNEAMTESGISPDAIAGLSVDATSATVLAMDGNDQHLRPAIMWMDVRATEEAKRIEETGHEALKYNGYGSVSAEWGLPKVMWLKKHESETYESAAHIVEAGDWLVNKLTGEWNASLNMAAGKYYHDNDEGGFPEGLYAELGVEDFLEKYPRNIISPSEVGGELSEQAAEQLGLRKGIPVAQGGIDAYMGALGLGVVEPGNMALITCSSHVMIGQTAEPMHGEGFWGAYTDAMIPGEYTVEAGQASTGSVVAWFKNRFAGDARADAERRDVDAYDILNELAADVPIGSEGLIVLEYFQGNRSPYTDPLVRGMMFGLSLSHGPGHMFRAILAGICFGTENIFRSLREGGFTPTETFVAGGPTKSELWMQMHADVSNLPLTIVKNGDVAPVLGSAMLAAVGAGVHADVKTAAERMVKVDRTIEPNEEAHEAYQFSFDRYVESYEQMRDTMHQVTRHVSDSD